ncbi:MAG: flagellar biosynthesis protein FlhF [Eubacterium sp.]|nr:flagellar biosynthesis protein FlhF [Eubacterium sp.]
MIIKKYLAKTEKEAIEMAKEDLGSNAIVMNIKKVHPKGLAKIFMRSKVEVTAALDDNPAASATTSAATSPAPSQTVSHVDIEIPKEVPEQTESEQSIQNKLMKLQLLLEKQMQQKDTELEKTAESKKTENAVKQQEETKETNDEKENAEKTGDKSSAYKELIYQQLIQNEVDSDIANSIMDEVSRSLPADAALDQILASVYQKIILMMGQPYVIKPDRKDKTQYIFFLGSTGVGKTTTIAKIASKLKLEQKAKIALVTADTYRIAAVEQLKTYANILSVPLKVIYSPEELGKMTDELEDYDICLVDTAGRSHKDKEQIEDIKKLIEQVPISDRQVYLVLNAGTKYSDLQEIASVYAKLTDFSLIFTKLDETSSSGVLLNMKMKTKCPLSYVTWGQNVPDDMGEVDAQKIAKELLSGN